MPRGYAARSDGKEKLRQLPHEFGPLMPVKMSEISVQQVRQFLLRQVESGLELISKKGARQWQLPQNTEQQ